MLTRIIQFSLRHRLLIVVAAVLLLLGGAYTAVHTEVDVFPDLNAPTVVVMTEAGGMAAEEVEQLVTFPLETAVNGATGVRRVRSSSTHGFSVVWVEFDWGTDIYTARQIVSEKLAAVAEQLPRQAGQPTLGPQSSILGEMLIVGLTADSTSLLDLRTLADWTLRPRLLSTGGVAQVSVMGGDIREYQVLIDPDRMRQWGVGLKEVLDATREMNVNANGGTLYQWGNEYLIRGMLATTDTASLGQAVVRPPDVEGALPVRLDDVARITVGAHTPKLGLASERGQAAVLLTVTKQPATSTLDLTRRIEDALEELAPQLPADVHLSTDIFRQSRFIESAIGNVREALLEGGVFVVVVLFLFLANVRTTVISLITLPLALLASVVTLHVLGLTLNTMSLGGLAIAIGSLVDDAIVDVENVYQRLRQNRRLTRERRLPVLQVVMNASTEVRMPILNSTLIIVVCFVPLFLLTGMEGRMLVPLGIAFIVALCASTVVALTLTPVLCSYLLGREQEADDNAPDALAGAPDSVHGDAPDAPAGTPDNIPATASPGSPETPSNARKRRKWILLPERHRSAPQGTLDASTGTSHPATPLGAEENSTVPTSSPSTPLDTEADGTASTPFASEENTPMPPTAVALARATQGGDSRVARQVKRVYARCLDYCLEHDRRVVALTALVTLAAVVVFFTLGRSFLPPFNEGSFTINVSSLPGISLDESDRIGRHAEELLLQIPEIETVGRKTGRAELDEHAMGVNASELEAPFTLGDRSRAELTADVRRRLSGLPGVQVEIGQPISHRLDAMLSGTQANIAIKLFGTDLNRLHALAQQVRGAVQDVRGVADLNVEQQVERPELTLTPRREMLARYGITLPELGEAVRVCLGGEVVSQVYEDGRSFDLTVRVDERFRNRIDRIGDLPVTTASGQQVPLALVADIRSTAGPNTISRENVSRKVVVSANVEGRDLRSVVRDMRSAIQAHVALPEGYHVEYGGQFESEQAASRTLSLACAAAIVVVFLLLYHQFANAPQCAIILINLPLAIIGGVFALRVTTGEVSIPAVIGFISLFGIATRGGMLLISRYRRLQEVEGLTLRQSVLRGSLDRLNPILMTALSSALALVPLALGGDLSGNEIQSPMAKVILGGLISSTLLNGFIVPIVYLRAMSKRNNEQ